ncbi:MAG: hypothetical protein M3285_01005 [Actinomycetota bacterium]|nr:hypothetical protein [Actinomycetota bacterium]
MTPSELVLAILGGFGYAILGAAVVLKFKRTKPTEKHRYRPFDDLR